MADPSVLYKSGDHASRPAADSGCVLYSCSTHSKVYKSSGGSGASWADFIDIATAAGAAAHIADASDAHDASAISFDPTGLVNVSGTDVQTAIEELDAAAGGGGGGGSALELLVDEDMSSIANFTNRNGTWTVSGGITQQTDSSGGTKFLQYTSHLPLASHMFYEVDVRVPSAGQAGGANESCGLLLTSLATAGGTGGAPIVGLRADSNTAHRIYWEGNASYLRGAITQAWVRDTWYTLRVETADDRQSIWLDGTLIGTMRVGSPDYGSDGGFLGLATQWSLKADFRNFKVWKVADPW